MNIKKYIVALCLLFILSINAFCQELTALHIPITKDAKVTVIFWKKIKSVKAMSNDCVSFDFSGQVLDLPYNKVAPCYIDVKLTDNKRYTIKVLPELGDRQIQTEYDYELDGEKVFLDAQIKVEQQTGENPDKVAETAPVEDASTEGNIAEPSNPIDFIKKEQLTKKVTDLINTFNSGLNNLVNRSLPLSRKRQDLEFIIKDCFNGNEGEDVYVITQGKNGKNPKKGIREYLNGLINLKYSSAKFKAENIQILSGFREKGNKYECDISYVQTFTATRPGPDGQRRIFQGKTLKTTTIDVEISTVRDSEGNLKTYFKAYLRTLVSEDL
jgi:hypothetical protein